MFPLSPYVFPLKNILRRPLFRNPRAHDIPHDLFFKQVKAFIDNADLHRKIRGQPLAHRADRSEQTAEVERERGDFRLFCLFLQIEVKAGQRFACRRFQIREF